MRIADMPIEVLDKKGIGRIIGGRIIKILILQSTVLPFLWREARFGNQPDRHGIKNTDQADAALKIS